MPCPAISLLPAQQGIHFDEASHRYWIWSPARNRWMQPASTSAVLTASGAKGFDATYWRRSLITKRGLRPHEADLYMDLHRGNRADIGTELHGLIRAELLGEPFHPRQAESLLLLAVWRREFLPRVERVVVCESPMVSRSRFYSGTPDLVALVEGLWLSVDWKSKVSREKARPESAWPLQLAGYDLLVEEQHGLALDGAMNLMIWPDGTQDCFYNAADMEERRQEFLGALVWSHTARALEGAADYGGALVHLLQQHPEAPLWRDPPESLGLWSLEQALDTALAASA